MNLRGKQIEKSQTFALVSITALAWCWLHSDSASSRDFLKTTGALWNAESFKGTACTMAWLLGSSNRIAVSQNIVFIPCTLVLFSLDTDKVWNTFLTSRNCSWINLQVKLPNGYAHTVRSDADVLLYWRATKDFYPHACWKLSGQDMGLPYN